jgi:hypothetical protein
VILLERQRGEERRVKERSKIPTKVWLKERYKLLFFLQRKNEVLMNVYIGFA